MPADIALDIQVAQMAGKVPAAGVLRRRFAGFQASASYSTRRLSEVQAKAPPQPSRTFSTQDYADGPVSNTVSQTRGTRACQD